MRRFVSDIFLFGFALAELVIYFIPMLLAKDHTVGLWYEDNMVILGLEIAVCLAAMVWAVYQIRLKIKQEGAQCGIEY